MALNQARLEHDARVALRRHPGDAAVHEACEEYAAQSEDRTRLMLEAMEGLRHKAALKFYFRHRLKWAFVGKLLAMTRRGNGSPHKMKRFGVFESCRMAVSWYEKGSKMEVMRAWRRYSRTERRLGLPLTLILTPSLSLILTLTLTLTMIGGGTA